MKTVARLGFGGLVLLGCAVKSPDEKAIEEMLTTFVTAIHTEDKVLAGACLLDTKAFLKLNPDAAARTDAESYYEGAIADLFFQYQRLVDHLRGRNIKFKELHLGTPWYQYKPHQAFRDTDMILSVDGEEVTIPIKGLVYLENKWRIVDLSGIELY